jgi:hypothetical protein
MTTFRQKGLKSPAGRADDRYVGNYDEMSTARLTWVVLDRLVPPEDEAAARAALIARDPELHSRVAQGAMTEDEALEVLRSREGRYGDGRRARFAAGAARWSKPVAVLAGATALLAALSHVRF